MRHTGHHGERTAWWGRHLQKWIPVSSILRRLIVCEREGTIVSSCVCVIIPNLTRGVRPYAFVENVVTRADARGHGYATACLNHAKALAQQAGCYKMMLLTGSHDPKTLDFYRHAGYSSTDKTAFIQWLQGASVSRYRIHHRRYPFGLARRRDDVAANRK